MKVKSLKILKGLTKFIIVICLLLSLSALGLTIYNMVDYTKEIGHFFYAFIGMFIYPIELLKLPGMFSSKDSLISLCVFCSALVVWFILMLILLHRMFNRKLPSKKRKNAGIFLIIALSLTVAWLILSSVLLAVKYKFLDNLLRMHTIGWTTYLTSKLDLFNILIVKEISFAVLFALLLFISTIRFMNYIFRRKKTKTFTVIDFYSSEYELVEQSVSKNNNKNDFAPTKLEDIKEGTIRGQNLIQKIMQLEELKRNGEISSVEYTKLRQRAIRRYKRKK